MTEVMTRDGIPAGLLLDPATIEDPYGFYRRLVDEAPVWRVPGTDVVIVSSYAAVTEATKRVEDFSSHLCALLYRNGDGTPGMLPFDAGEGIQSLATADPPLHTVHRNTVFPELVAKRMGQLRPDVEELTDRRLGHALDRGAVEVMGDLANAIPIRIVSTLIGFEDEDPDALLAAAFESTAVLAATGPLEEMFAATERTAEIAQWITDQLEHARAHGAEGVLGVIAAAVNDGTMGAGHGLVIMHTLLSAGGESTTGLIGNAIHLLASDQDLQARLRDDPGLVTPFLEEALRLESPFRYHMRHVARRCELGGVELPAGATMLLFWGAANRDPAEFDRPDQIVLDRPTPKHHLGFGRGIHFCVGAPLARLEAEVVLTRLLGRTERFTLDPDRPPVRVDSLMVRRFASLHLVATPAAVA